MVDAKSKFTVVQDGNPRGNDVSEEEIKQCIKDLVNWFDINAKDISDGLKNSKPATDDEIKKIADIAKTTVPTSLILLLKAYNGNFLLSDNFKSLTVEEIVDSIDVNSVNGYWKKDYIPFALDEEKNFLVIQHDNGKELKVLSWCLDMGVIEDVTDSLGLLLERTRNGVLKKTICYVEGAGLVEDSN